MAEINIVNLTFGYEGSYDNVFENVNFRIDTDWKLGFIGRNGRGKTTFLNLLMGKYSYRGRIVTDMEFTYFPYEVQDRSKETYEIVSELAGGDEDWQIYRELSLLGVDAEVLYRPFSTLSYGEATKVLLAALFLGEHRFLLIDEPTNHLDTEARELVASYLAGKKGFIVVSHDRAFLDKVVDHILSINKANIEVQKGNFSSWYENKRLQDEFELKQNEKLKKEITRLERSMKEKMEWSDRAEDRKIGFNPVNVEKSLDRRAFQGAKAKKAMKRAKDIEQKQQGAIDEKSALLKNIDSADDLKLLPLIYPKETMVRFLDVTLAYDKKVQEHAGGETCEKEVREERAGSKVKTVQEGLNLEIHNGDRIVLRGRNGCGKSSVIKAILMNSFVDERVMGADHSLQTETTDYRAHDTLPIITRGTVAVYGGLKISYISQDTSFLVGTIDEYARSCGVDETLLRTMLRKLDFSREQFSKNMEDFSGGQKKKVLIATSLCCQAHLYIWDEPLNYIDLMSRIQIEDLIMKFQPTMLLVEHDETFCEKVGTKVVRL